MSFEGEIITMNDETSNEDLMDGDKDDEMEEDDIRSQGSIADGI